MSLYVNIQTCSLGKTIITEIALVWFFSCVQPLVILPRPLGRESLPTPLTYLWLLASVSSLVFHQLGFVISVVITIFAFKLSYFGLVGTSLVVSQLGIVTKTFTTLITHPLFIRS